MEHPDMAKGRWPFGYRLLLWAVGSLAVIMLIMAVLFVLNAPRA